MGAEGTPPHSQHQAMYPKTSPHAAPSQESPEHTLWGVEASPMVGCCLGSPQPRQHTYLGDCPCIHELRQHQPRVQEGVAGEVQEGPCPCAVRRGQPGGRAGRDSPVQLRGGPCCRDATDPLPAPREAGCGRAVEGSPGSGRGREAAGVR
uniref:Uncharacterized protein n=1 Tax=Athene cunicularia TaxID=194338 RepID=A0A663MQ94_ATHCN